MRYVPERRAGAKPGTAGQSAAEEDMRLRMAALARAARAEIVPRMASGLLPGSDQAEPGRIAALAQHAASSDPAPLFAAVAAARAAGTSVETLSLELLAPAARHLGELWLRDEYDFTQVMLGTMRLHQALRECAIALPALPAAGRVRRALLLPVPDEQHSFGAAVVAESFRAAGWAVRGGPLRTPAELTRALRRSGYDLVGFSASTPRHVESLAACIALVRRAARGTPVVMLGGPLFDTDPGLAVRLGADAACTDARRAPGMADALLRLRPAPFAQPSDLRRIRPGQAPVPERLRAGLLLAEG